MFLRKTRGVDSYPWLPDYNSSIDGVIFEINHEELLAADRYETEAWIYVAS